MWTTTRPTSTCPTGSSGRRILHQVPTSSSLRYSYMYKRKSAILSSVADPDTCLFDPWIREKSGSGSGIRIRDEQPGSYFWVIRNHFFGLKYLNFFMRIWDVRDPGWKNSDPGWKNYGSGTRDKHPGSATPLARHRQFWQPHSRTSATSYFKFQRNIRVLSSSACPVFPSVPKMCQCVCVY